MKLNIRNRRASPVFYCTIRENTGVTCARIPHIQRLVYSDLLKTLKKTAHPHIRNTLFSLTWSAFYQSRFLVLEQKVVYLFLQN